MAAYMKNRFMVYGVDAPSRRRLQKPFLERSALPPIPELRQHVEDLWDADARELQYTALDLVEKYKRVFRREDLSMLEFMASEKQWWDSIDAIASKLMGAYFKRFPDERKQSVERWLASGDMWLQRCGILFQLKYKEDTDTDLLEEAILPVRQSDEFFIQKAIGWALREYRKTNREWVDALILRVELKPLSRREALKHG
jgi:3-methyladenine DNA glycosylase AlkD